MTIDTLSRIVDQTLKTPNLSKLKASDKDKSQGHKKAIASLIPYIGGAVAEELQQYYDYKDDEFFRKFARFLLGIKETSAEERHKFAEEIQNRAEDFSGNVICGMVDRLDNINKETIFANLSVARIHGLISVEDFFRLHSLLVRIPYVDMKNLPYYKEPYYDESGDSELLFATGSLNQHTIDANGPSKYVLSTLGEKLLCFGLGIKVEMDRELGTNIEVDSASEEDIEGIFSQKLAEAQRKQEEKEYIESDRAMFDYDVIRGK